jgi:hypothetical protein
MHESDPNWKQKQRTTHLEIKGKSGEDFDGGLPMCDEPCFFISSLFSQTSIHRTVKFLTLQTRQYCTSSLELGEEVRWPYPPAAFGRSIPNQDLQSIPRALGNATSSRFSNVHAANPGRHCLVVEEQSVAWPP